VLGRQRRLPLVLASAELALGAAWAIEEFRPALQRPGYIRFSAGTPPAAAQYQYGGKVTICHHTPSQTNPFVTISVSPSSAAGAQPECGLS